MAKSARTGEMRARITVQALASGIDQEGVAIETWTDVFGGEKVWCKWVNAHGLETYEAMRQNLREAATITMRYTPLIDVRCRIFKGHTPTGDPEKDDPQAYEVVSVDDVENRHKTMEIKVHRAVKS